MRLPRFTVRRILIAVAIVGVMLALMKWIERRREAFRRELVNHQYKWISEKYKWRSTSANPDKQLPPARCRYEEEMVKRYTYAVQYPWMPVMPDPPAPE
jgi:hypothetical protein